MIDIIREDEFMYHYNRLQKFTEALVDIDEFELIFEADDPEVKEKQEHNNKIMQGISSSASGIINALQKLIAHIKTQISGFLKKLKMNDTERKAYESFKAACEKDPAMKNKKITVLNYQELQKEYESINKRCEQALLEADKGKTEFDALFEDMKSFTKKVGGDIFKAGRGLTLPVAAEVAFRQAASSKMFASKLADQLNQDSALVEQLRESLGNRKFNKYKKDVENLSKNFSVKGMLLRSRLNMAGAYSRSLEMNIQKTLDDISDLGLNRIKNTWEGNAEIGQSSAKDQLKQGWRDYKGAMKRDIHSFGEFKDAVADSNRGLLDMNDARRAMHGAFQNSKRIRKNVVFNQDNKHTVGSVLKGVGKAGNEIGHDVVDPIAKSAVGAVVHGATHRFWRNHGGGSTAASSIENMVTNRSGRYNIDDREEAEEKYLKKRKEEARRLREERRRQKEEARKQQQSS